MSYIHYMHLSLDFSLTEFKLAQKSWNSPKKTRSCPQQTIKSDSKRQKWLASTVVRHVLAQKKHDLACNKPISPILKRSKQLARTVVRRVFRPHYSLCDFGMVDRKPFQLVRVLTSWVEWMNESYSRRIAEWRKEKLTKNNQNELRNLPHFQVQVIYIYPPASDIWTNT